MTIQMEAIVLWEPEIESLGLTYDTPLGDVDLVAIDRARSGHKVTLTEAEFTWLAIELGPLPKHPTPEQIDARQLVAEALGITLRSLHTRLNLRLRREWE